MKIKQYSVVIMAMLMVFISSCGGSDSTDDVLASKEQISVSNRNISFLAEGGSTEVSINANCDWMIRVDGEEVNWLTVNPTAGKGTGSVTLRAAANTTAASRTAYLTIAGKLVSQSITVTQKAGEQQTPSAKAPVISGSSYRDVTTTAAVIVLSASSETAITEYGVCYSSSSRTPGENDLVAKRSSNSTVLSNAVVELTGLSPQTTYYARVFARSAAGTTFGEVLSFTTGSNVPGSGDNIPPTP